MKFDEIKKVRMEGNIKKITIPKNSNINQGDFVMIAKVPDDSVLGSDAVG